MGGVVLRVARNTVVLSPDRRPVDLTISAARGLRGYQGDPGGNVMAVGLFTDIVGMTIPVGVDMIQTTGHSVKGIGSARYVSTATTGATAARTQTANGRWFELAEKLASFEMLGARGDGATDDADAIEAGLALTGVSFDGLGRDYKIGRSIVANDRDVRLRDVSLTASAPYTLTLGGKVDTTVTVGLTITEIAASAREFAYNSLAGVIAAGDWLLITGRLDGAWTTIGGRNVLNGYLVQVRAIDTGAKIIKLYQPILERIDTSTIDGVVQALAVQKITTRVVSLEGVTTRNVSVNTSYVIDSRIDVTMEDAASTGTSTSVTAAHNTEIKARSRARQTSNSAHSLIVQYLYDCQVDAAFSAANYSATAAKALRLNGINLTRITARFLSVGLAEFIAQVMVGCEIHALAADNGAWNTDNLVATVNRNDSFQINYGHGCTGSLSSLEPDATAMELFGCLDCDFSAKVIKTRVSPATNAELINIKGATRRSKVRPFVRCSVGQSVTCVKLEHLNLSDGLPTQDCQIIDPDIECDVGSGVVLRDPVSGETSIDARHLIQGGRIKARIPVVLNPAIDNCTVQGCELIINTVEGENSHGVVCTSTGNLFKDLIIRGGATTTRRAIQMQEEGNEVENVWSDSGYFVYDPGDLANFDVRQWRHLNQPIAFGDKTLKLYPEIDGFWSVDATEWFDTTLFERALIQDPLDGDSLDFGIWRTGDRLRKRDSARGETGWYWNGTTFIRDGFKVLMGQRTYDVPSVAAGASATFDVTVTGANLRDRVTWGYSIGGLGMMQVTAYVSADDTVTINLHNPTGSAINPVNGTWYVSVQAATT